MRHHNRKADGLAILGKGMAGEDVKVVFNDCTIGREINHVRGYWDGGYDDAEPDMVGVGWHIQFREQLPLTNDDLWMPLMHGYGKSRKEFC